MLRNNMVRAEFMRRLDGMVKVESGVSVKGQRSNEVERGLWPGPRLQKRSVEGEDGFQRFSGQGSNKTWGLVRCGDEGSDND